MICRACNRENRSDARFCDGCGAALAVGCSACGNDLRPDARFCDSCGASTEITNAPASPPESTERSPRDYTPRHLAEKILQSKSALEGERKQVTVLFADVRGSMELSERLGPEAWHGVLERFFEIVTQGVHQFEGTVNQYTGDGVMALFGAPIAHEDHAHRACFAALKLQEGLREYADELRRTQGLSFSMRIGLNSGDVVVGKIGDDLRMDYTAQGHTVGLAQRMEQRAAPNSTCLTEHTARLVEGYFALRALGEFELKGVSGQTSGYALEGLGEVRTRLDRSRVRGFSRFVGRNREVASLTGALENAAEGAGNVVGIVAQAGVGKSRLCLEFVERCRAQGVAVYEAHCLSHGRAIPLLPVLELLKASFGLQDEDSPQLAREKITGRLMLLDREFETLLPLAFEFLAVADPGAPPLNLSPEERQRQCVDMSRRILHARGAREPAVILIDDVHWIDPASDAFLAAIAEITPLTRTLLLLNFRPEYSADWMTSSTYQQIPLHPLGDAAVDELLEDLLGSHPSLAPLPPLVRERSAGNPFYVEEIVQNLREIGSLEGARGNSRLLTAVEQLAVPSTVQAILSARIDRLGEREKHLLQTAAAIGRRFPETLLRAVSGLADLEFDDAIRSLKASEFIHAEVIYPVAEYAFRHPLTHEVAELSQLAGRRRMVHGAVARELEEANADVTGENAALLAHHWDEAGEAEPAARWHRAAAEWIAGSNVGEASRHWQRVRALADQIDDEELAGELGQRSRLMILEYGWRLGVPEDEANLLLAEGEAWAQRRGDDHALAELYNAFAMPAVLAHGTTRRADELIAKGLSHVARTDDRVLTFALELRLYLMEYFRGDVHGMRSTMERLESYSREVMDAATPLVGYDAHALVVGYKGYAEILSGHFALGLVHYRAGLDVARASGAREVVSWLLAMEAACMILQGGFVSAAPLSQEALQLSEEIENPLSISWAAGTLASALVQLGQSAEALPLVERALEYATLTVRSFVPRHLATLARAHFGQGNERAAATAAHRAVTEADALEFPEQQVLARLAAAMLDSHGDENSQRSAARRLDEAYELIEHSGERAYLPELWEIRAQLASRAGDLREQVTCLKQARELHLEFDAPLQVTRMDELLAAAEVQ